MRIAVHSNNAEHQVLQAGWLADGLRCHGVEVIPAQYDEPVECDACAVWGWHQGRIKAAGRPILVMERGHIQDRMAWTSLGWNGLSGRGRYPTAQDGGERFARHFGHHLKDWRHGGSYALIMGQTPGDAAVEGLDIVDWATRISAELQAVGHLVRFRAHPNCAARAERQCPVGAELSTGCLDDDLAGAALVVTFNSTSGVEAALAGVPLVVMDRGGMAYPVAAHTIWESGITPDRAQWCADMAWTQWSEDELRRGAFWEAVRSAMPEIGSSQ
jgi:hypothetical protein